MSTFPDEKEIQDAIRAFIALGRECRTLPAEVERTRVTAQSASDSGWTKRERDGAVILT